MKNVLLISYHFPPDAAVGAFRCQKFAKYLPAHGWIPHILTVKERHYHHLDPSRLSDVASARIVRTGSLPSPLSALLTVRSALWRALGRSDVARPNLEAVASTTRDERQQPAPGIRAAVRRLVLSLGRLPDDQIGWVPHAVSSGLRICRRQHIDAIVSTSPPHSAHLVGLLLKRMTGIRWVADFRDPWVGHPVKLLSQRTKLSDRIDARLERAVVLGADRVVLLTERMCISFLSRYPQQRQDKFSTIYNGFDADDFAAVGPVSPDPFFTLAHIGSLYHQRSPRGLLASIANLLQRGKIPRSDIRIVFMGETHDGQQPDVLGKSLGLTDLMQVSGPVSHRQALTGMRQADLLCLFVQGWSEQIPAKTFEYLAAGAPILAVAGEGAAADFVTKAGGIVVPDEPWAIEEAIHQQYLRYRAGFRPAALPSPWTREEVRPLDRHFLTGKLATLLEPSSS